MSAFDALVARLDNAIAATFGDMGYTVRVGTGSPHTVIVERGTASAGEFGGTPFRQLTVSTRLSEVDSRVADVVVRLDVVGVPVEAFRLDALQSDDGHLRTFVALAAPLPVA